MPGNLTNVKRKGLGLYKTDVGMTLEGDHATRIALESLKTATQRRIMRLAMVAAVRVVAKEAKRLAPRDSGLLRKAIGSKSITYPSGTTVGIVGPRRGFGEFVDRRAFQAGEQDITTKTGKVKQTNVIYSVHRRYADPIHYAHLVEEGTQPHSIGGGSLIKAKGGQGVNQLGASHPGTKGTHFMRRSWQGKQGEAMAIFKAKLAEGTQREVLKLGAKARNAIG